MFGLELIPLLKGMTLSLILLTLVWWVIFMWCEDFKGTPKQIRLQKIGYVCLYVFSFFWVTTGIYIAQVMLEDNKTYWEVCKELNGSRVVIKSHYVCVHLEEYKKGEELMSNSIIEIEGKR